MISLTGMSFDEGQKFRIEIHFDQLLELRSSPKVTYSSYKIIMLLGNADSR